MFGINEWRVKIEYGVYNAAVKMQTQVPHSSSCEILREISWSASSIWEEFYTGQITQSKALQEYEKVIAHVRELNNVCVFCKENFIQEKNQSMQKIRGERVRKGVGEIAAPQFELNQWTPNKEQRH